MRFISHERFMLLTENTFFQYMINYNNLVYEPGMLCQCVPHSQKILALDCAM